MVKYINVLWIIVFVIFIDNKYAYLVRDEFVMCIYIYIYIYEKYVWIICERCNL